MLYTITLLLLIAGLAHAQDIIWVRNGETANSHFGGFIFPLGDQNDDGFDDWAVYASGNANGPDSEESFDFFYGGNPPLQVPYLSFHPRTAPAESMLNLRPIGDFNGDGIVDCVIGRWPHGQDSILFEFYRGGDVDTIPDAVLHVPHVFGDDLGTVGDHNGDGFDDLYRYNSDGPDLTYIMLGNTEWDFSVDLTNQGEPIGSFSSMPTMDVYGDFNGDSYEDYFARKHIGFQDCTLVYFGTLEPDTIPDITWPGNFAFPATLSADLNSDGAADLAVGGQQTVAVHLGGEAPSPIPTFVLNIPGCPEAGTSELSSAGDYNRDGFDDLIMMSRACENGFGAMELYLGGFWLNANPVLRIEGVSAPPFHDVQLFRAIGVGDVNGDGIDDLAIGCQGDVLNSRRGKVVILSGDTTLRVPVGELPPVAEEFSMAIYPNPANGYVNIAWENTTYQGGELFLYNLFGQQVSEIVLRPGATSMRYDVSPLASGIYLVRADFGIQSMTKRLVVLK